MRTRKYKNIETLQKACCNQLTLENLLHRRVYHKKAGWININNLINEDVAQEIADLLGGIGKTKEAVKRTLLFYPSISHWGLGRILYNDKRKCFVYCAGQDYTAELKEIRNALK